MFTYTLLMFPWPPIVPWFWQHYHECLEANGVTGYSLERCWRDYKLNLWRPLISVCAIAPSIEAAHRNGTGLFAQTPTKGDRQLRQMYDKLNERIVAAAI